MEYGYSQRKLYHKRVHKHLGNFWAGNFRVQHNDSTFLIEDTISIPRAWRLSTFNEIFDEIIRESLVNLFGNNNNTITN